MPGLWLWHPSSRALHPAEELKSEAKLLVLQALGSFGLETAFVATSTWAFSPYHFAQESRRDHPGPHSATI